MEAVKDTAALHAPLRDAGAEIQRKKAWGLTGVMHLFSLSVTLSLSLCVCVCIIIFCIGWPMVAASQETTWCIPFFLKIYCDVIDFDWIRALTIQFAYINYSSYIRK